MAFRNIQVILSAHNSNLRQVLAQSGREVDQFANKVNRANKTGMGTGTMLKAGLAAGAVAVGTAVAYATAKAAGFETRMRNVNSITGASEQGLAKLGKQVIGLSRELPQSANTLAEGLYDIASSGFQGAKGLIVLRAAAEAASAGLSTTAVAGKAITAVLNAYGRGAEDAQDVSDVLFQTVNVGVVSFEELASQIGDVIGMAAAAKVPIEDVGAAVAAMTLSGIGAAESTTSLNRVIQSLIKPSDQMATVLQTLGYESGAQALEVDGLRGVMEKLRIVTGGNIESLLQLFPEIRAARGALALMADEGRNYKETSDAITDAENRQGATRKALNEQMKAVSAQFQLFRNRIDAAAIELGTRFLPLVLKLLSGIQALARNAIPGLRGAINALMPFWRGLRDIGIDIIQIAKNLYDALGPVGKVLLGLTAGGVITALNTIATILSAVTGFLADHTELVMAAAIAWGIHLLPALISSATALGAMALDKIAFGLYAVGGGADKAAASFSLMGVAATAATVGVALLLAGMVSRFADADRRAKDLRNTLTAGLDLSSYKGLGVALSELQVKEQEIAQKGRASGGWSNSIKGLFNADIERDRQAVEELLKGQDEISKKRRESYKNLKAVNDELGRENTVKNLIEMDELAVKLGIDTTLAGEAGVAAQKELKKHVDASTKAIGVNQTTLTEATGLNIEKIEALAEAIKKAQEAATKAFSASNDLFSGFDSGLAKTTQDAVADARADLVDAEKDLAKLQDRRNRDKTISVADDQALAEARDRVATATGKVREAEKGVVSDAQQIKKFYEDRIKQSKDFAGNLQKAVQQGLDPAFIQRTLEAGPEAAGPILQAIVADNSGKMAQMVNDSEKALREIGSKVAEFARLTTLAVNSSTDQMTRDLSTAMRIAAANMAEGGTLTAEAIAKSLGVPTPEIIRIAQAYGITLAQAVNQGIASVGIAPPGSFSTPGFDPQSVIKQRWGGIQAGVAKSPTVLFGERETGGEAYVPRLGNKGRSVATLSQAASWYGHRVVPMAAGGFIPTPIAGAGSRGSGSSSTSITRSSRIDFHGDMIMTDPKAAVRYAQQQKRRNALIGAD